jgi:cytochrome P450
MTDLLTDRLPVVDLSTLASLDDPYSVLGELRLQSPIVKGTVPLVWGVTRHEEVSALLRDDRLSHEFPRPYISFQTGEGPAVDFFQNVLLNRDAPDHTRLRTLMGKAFRGLTVRKLYDHIDELVTELLRPALDRETFDVVTDLASPLPVQVICELLGFPQVDRDDVRTNAAGMISIEPERIHPSTVWMRDYVRNFIEERSADAEGDLLQRMLAAEDGEDAFTHDEIIDNVLLLFFAGFETTTNLIANGCAALIENPDEMRRLWFDPTLAPTAVEEFLRYDPPLPFVNRLTREPMEIGGRMIKEGRVIALLIASANYDETVFARPEALDITRKPNPHLAFGGGIHHCLGAMLARLEGEIVFRRLAERTQSLEADGPPVRRQASAVRSFESVPVRATAA